MSDIKIENKQRKGERKRTEGQRKTQRVIDMKFRRHEDRHKDRKKEKQNNIFALNCGIYIKIKLSFSKMQL